MMESVLGFIILKFILLIFSSRKIEDVSSTAPYKPLAPGPLQAAAVRKSSAPTPPSPGSDGDARLPLPPLSNL